MRKLCLVFWVLVLVNYSELFAQKVKHVVLISLDGSRPEFHNDTTWQAYNLQKLKSEGAYAENGVQSIFPSLTWPAHASIITGANPDKHGIFYNRPFDGSPGQGYWYNSYLQTETIFDAIKEAGMTSGAVWWPSMVGGPVNYNFPVKRPEARETRFDQLEIRYPYIEPKSLLTDIELEIGRKFTVKDLEFENGAQAHLVTDISNHIIKKYKPNFLAIHLGDMDHAQHVHGTESKELREAVKFMDSLVGSILNTIEEAGIKDSTAIIITGDHGHTNTKSIFAPNTYLVEHGIINEYGWKAIFHSAGGAAFLHMKKENDTATLDAVTTILKESDEYKKGLFRILYRKELEEMGANPNTPLAIAMKEGVTVSNSETTKTFREQTAPFKSTHGYDPAYQSMMTTFIATGPGIEHQNIQNMKLVDIAPFIAELLGLDFIAPDGRLIEGILKK